MTLILELPTELEEQLQTQAQQPGIAAGDIAQDAMVFYLAALGTLNQRVGNTATNTDAQNDGITNPPPINGNTRRAGAPMTMAATSANALRLISRVS